jgi:cyclic beta-1,2-glucan glucanotransferase
VRRRAAQCSISIPGSRARGRRFGVTFRYHASRYEITVENPRGATRGISQVEVDGTRVAPGSASIPLTDDSATRRVRVVLG